MHFIAEHLSVVHSAGFEPAKDRMLILSFTGTIIHEISTDKHSYSSSSQLTTMEVKNYNYLIICCIDVTAIVDEYLGSVNVAMSRGKMKTSFPESPGIVDVRTFLYHQWNDF